MYLWKYFSSDRVHVLEDLKLRFTPAGMFNDPFEVMPHIGAILPETESDQFWLRTLAENPGVYDESLRASLAEAGLNLEDCDTLLKMNGIPATARDLFAPRNFQGKFLGIADEMTSRLVSSMESTFPSSFQKRFGDHFGVLCLSGNPASLLMWAHYASSHTGYVLGVKVNHPFFHPTDARAAIGHLLPVRYSEERPSITVYDPRANVNDMMERLIREVLLTKSADWQYEQETRFILPLNNMAAHPHETDSEGRHLFALPADAVGVVIIGARTSHATRESIREILERKLPTVPLFRARVSNTEFKLIVEPL